MLEHRLIGKEEDDIRSEFLITCIFTVQTVVTRKYGWFRIHHDTLHNLIIQLNLVE